MRSWKSLVQFTFDIFMNKMMNFGSETDLYFVEAQIPYDWCFFFVICSRYICAGVIILKALTKIARLFISKRPFTSDLRLMRHLHEWKELMNICMKWAEIVKYAWNEQELINIHEKQSICMNEQKLMNMHEIVQYAWNEQELMNMQKLMNMHEWAVIDEYSWRSMNMHEMSRNR